MKTSFIAVPFVALMAIAVIFYSPWMNLNPPADVAADPPPTHHSNEICTKTTLYTLTFHPQKEKTILCHPDAKTMQKENQDNILFNLGVVQAQQHPLQLKCPNNNKGSQFCQGWNFQKRYFPSQ